MTKQAGMRDLPDARCRAPDRQRPGIGRCEFGAPIFMMLSIRRPIFRFALLLATACIARPSAAQIPAPSQDSLDGITARGRALVAYDRAAWHATDAVMALEPGPGEIRAYLARREGAGWVVAFGHPDSASGNFRVTYEAVQSPTRSDSFTVTRHAPARVDSGALASAARAFNVVAGDFGQASRPYNLAVLPASDSGWFAYVMPAQTHPRSFPLGGDVRYHVSPDGRRILVKRQLHKAILDFEPPPDSTPEAAGSPSVGSARSPTEPPS